MRVSERMAIVAIIWVGVQFFLTGAAEARYHPGIQWRTYRDSLTTVYYPAGHEAFARRVIGKSREVTGDVGGYFGYVPRRIPIVLYPYTDSFNGFFSPYPNRIALFETPVARLRGFGPSLSDLVDLVYTHEYTHFVHITMPGKWTRVPSKFLGEGILMTNIVSPGWVIEGITTNLETRFTDGGRGRSPWFNGVMRSANPDTVWSLSAIGVAPSYAPPGARFYLGGYHMVDYLHRTYGADAFAEFATYQANHPFGGSRGAITHVTGVSPEQFHADFARDFIARADSIRSAAASVGLPAGRVLWSSSLDGIMSHCWSPEGTILALRSGYESPTALLEIDPESGAVEDSVETGILRNYTPIRYAGDDRLLFGERVYHPLGEGDIDSAELVVFDPESRARQYLTKGAHVFSADRSGTRGTIVAARRSGMWSELVLIDDQYYDIDHLAGVEGMYFDSPVWSPDGAMIVVGVKTGGNTDIALVDPDNGEVRTLFTPDNHGDLDPVFSPDGAWVVFASDRSGIWNIYAFHITDRRLFRLTSVVTAAYEPRISPDGAYLSFLSLRNGIGELRIMPFEPIHGHEMTVGPAELIDTSEIEQAHAQLAGTIDNSGGIPFAEAYFPFIHAPYLSNDDRGAAAGLFLSGGDPVGINQYTALVRHGFESKQWGYDLTLINRSLWPVLTLHTYDSTDELVLRGLGDDFWTRERGVDLYADLPVLHRVVPDILAGTYRAGARYRYFSGIDPVRIDPDRNLAVSLFTELLLVRHTDHVPRHIVQPGSVAFYATREQYTGCFGANIPGYHMAASLSGQLASPIRHHGIWAGVAVQQQDGLVINDKDPFLPRGYDEDDSAGGMRERKTMTMSVEYRFPLAYPDAGVGMGTLHINRVEGALFCDIGAGWDDRFSMSGWMRRARSSIGITGGVDINLLSLVPVKCYMDVGYNPRERDVFTGVRFGLGMSGIGTSTLMPRSIFREPFAASNVQY